MGEGGGEYFHVVIVIPLSGKTGFRPRQRRERVVISTGNTALKLRVE